ncbi:glycosyltransferase family 4 protein [Amycolatopsis sp. H20-H5]|uniref:glycosyltransferase family 4 protein n=1 Tax=Amycolatopsis sp. H20-H5 TaxID=3046309 RepID=UPI002DBB1671|nr:glycosyltransferase family 4 protein [Amycolatopsis sp. H20-H5]MEC3976919.1 glycosyltransferase family 4 protein [Amycolatopsis sp. H20-H5]
MDVLVVFGGYRPGFAGAERMAWRTTEQLAALGHRVAMLTDSARPDGMAPPYWPVFATPSDVDHHYRRTAPDVVHAFDLAKPDHVDFAAGLAARYGVPFALTPCSAPGVWPDRERCAAACRAADVVFALTLSEVDDLAAAGAPARRIRVIPHAADLGDGPRPERFRREHGLSERSVLFVGRRTAFKGYAALLETTRLVWRTLPDTDFVFAGPNSDADAAERFRAHAGPRVHDLGVVDEPTKHDALAACSVFCLPTSVDVFPLVFLEAWACGKPVVSGDFAGVEHVVRAGVDGLVVRPRPPELAAALTWLLTDTDARDALGRAGRDRVSREHGWAKVAGAVEDGYATITATMMRQDTA